MNSLDQSRKVKVVFVGGAARSGSTILDCVLGQIDGFFSVGEFRLIWEEGFVGNYLCGCGKSFRSCSFWNAVVEKVFGGFEKVVPSSLLTLWRSVDRIRNIPKLAFSAFRSSSFQSVYSEYLDILNRMYKAVYELSGCKIIVDSSKSLSHGLLLNSSKEIDLRVIHLVRDSRAVAFSMQRKKHNPAVTGAKGEAYMGRQGVLASARDWFLANSIASTFSKLFPYYTLLRYEDFAEQPKKELERVFKSLKLNLPQINFFISDNTVKVGINHTVSGNPVRLHHGEIKLRPDVVWTQRMPTAQKLVVTLITWPLLFKYGYFK